VRTKQGQKILQITSPHLRCEDLARYKCQTIWGRETLPVMCTTQSINTIIFFLQFLTIPTHSQDSLEHINEYFVWGFFDGSS
jgi:hypothetical protein